MSTLLLQLLWVPVSFLFGALPLSVWIGQLAGHDIRQVGDGNPGATNVLRAAGPRWFALAICADFSKGAIPLGLAYYVFGWDGWTIWLMGMAPPLGHAFSPFLGGRGGKGLASMLGVWIGLTLWRVPAVALIGIVLFNLLIRPAGWAVLATTAVIMLYLLFIEQPQSLLFITIMLGHIGLILYTHAADFQQRPQFKRRGK